LQAIALICNIVAMNLAIQHPILKRSLTGILLLLFAFSIMPKRILHDWLVSHTDGITVVTGKGHAVQLSKAGFNCNCQNLVAESPFTANSQSFDIPPLFIYVSEPGAFPCQVYKATLFFSHLRGPPVES
jgi:hypothetical protein